MTAESSDSWAGWYRDRQGAESITFVSHGSQVSIRIRGVDYRGDDFATLCPVGSGEALTSCVMEWDMPLRVVHADSEQRATVNCLLTLHDQEGDAVAGRPELLLTLHWQGAAFASGISGGGFEEALDRIRRQLPGGTQLGDRPLVGA